MNSFEYNFEVNEKDESLIEDINLEADEDDVIAKKVAMRLQEAKKMHDERCAIARENMLIFDGKIDEVMSTGERLKYNSKALKNVIFLTIRNMVGLTTDSAIMPDVSPAKETPQSQTKSKTIALSLENDMTRTKFQDRLGSLLFDTWIKNDSFLHWFWNYDINDNDFIEVKIEDLSIANGATSITDAEYVVYHPFKNRLWWKTNYPDAYDKIKFSDIKDGQIKEDAKRGSSARLISYWENDMRVEQVMGKDNNWIILKKSKNPYWEYRSTDEQIMEWVSQVNPNVAMIAQETGLTTEDGVKQLMSDPEINPGVTIQDMEEFKPIINFLSEPTKPFIQIPSIKLLDDLYSKNLIGQIKQAFFDMNLKKRQVADNLRGCNIKMIVDSTTFNEKQATKITDEPFQVVRVDFSVNPKPFYYAQPAPLQLNEIYADMQDDAQYIDDVFGHHDISRGNGNAGTLGQDQMNLESDRTPIRYQVRALENAIVEMWKGWIQLKKMFYTDVHYIKRMGATDGMNIMELMSHDIEEGIEPILRPMSLAPISKAAKSQQSMNLFGAGALDPYTLYQDLGRNDPQTLTNRLLNWVQFGMISADDPEEVKADLQNHANTPGDAGNNPIEMAQQENKAIQNGTDVPPTAPEFVTKEHVKLHIAFSNDPKYKMEQDAQDTLLNHIEADKATLVELMKQGMLNEAQAQAQDVNMKNA